MAHTSTKNIHLSSIKKFNWHPRILFAKPGNHTCECMETVPHSLPLHFWPCSLISSSLETDQGHHHINCFWGSSCMVPHPVPGIWLLILLNSQADFLTSFTCHLWILAELLEPQWVLLKGFLHLVEWPLFQNTQKLDPASKYGRQVRTCRCSLFLLYVP